MRWVEALKEYAKKKGKYVVPKKGTPEYDEVRAIMGAAKGEAKADEAKGDVAKAEAHKVEEKALKAVERTGKVRKPRAKKPVAEKPAESAKIEAPPVVRKSRKVATKSQDAVDANPKRTRRKKAVAGSVPKGVDFGGATAKALIKSSNPEGLFEQMTNEHLPVNPAGAVPALKLPKSSAPESQVKLMAGEQPLPKLVQKAAVHNADAFSFQALRRHLGA